MMLQDILKSTEKTKKMEAEEYFFNSGVTDSIVSKYNPEIPGFEQYWEKFTTRMNYYKMDESHARELYESGRKKIL